MPRIVACGSRGEAYEKFRMAVGQGQKAFLLVDSESSVDAKHATGQPDAWKPWEHFHRQANKSCSKPASASDKDCHVMVQVMESWFLTDKETLAAFFPGVPQPFASRTEQRGGCGQRCRVPGAGKRLSLLQDQGMLWKRPPLFQDSRAACPSQAVQRVTVGQRVY